MKNPFEKAFIESVVMEEIASVMMVEADEVSVDASIVEGLGADSLDYVEINANLEKRLGMSFPKKSVLEHAEEITGDNARFQDEGYLTAEGVSILENSLWGYTGLKVGQTQRDIYNATAVRNVINFCHRIFDFLPDACPECGGHSAVVSPKNKVVCESCSAPLRPLSGDDAAIARLGESLEATVEAC